MENILNIDNWIIVGLALLKMAYYFWPVAVAAGLLMWHEHVNEVKRQKAQRILIKSRNHVKNL